MHPITGDLAQFIKCVHGKPTRMIGTYADGVICVGNGDFQKKLRMTGRRFKAKKKERDFFTFAGIKIKEEGKTCLLDQQTYAKNLQKLSLDCAFVIIRGRRHELTKPTHTGPELCASVGFLSKIPEERLDREAMKMTNNSIKRAKKHSSRGLRQNDLDQDALAIATFSDSSFANNKDFGTQLGNTNLLTDKPRRANWLSSSSYKRRRVVESVLGGKLKHLRPDST